MIFLDNYKFILLILSLYILASSTDVEQSFSQGGLTISKLQHSLSDQIIQLFKDKHKRPNKKQKVTDGGF
ncbi:hypothetical protein BYT27DRAFT_7076869 [Phlegmacium glaucopus]|nr:hypothetical protein BYT27DRAFT_7076869 [Phlegmacium glaucopus]